MNLVKWFSTPQSGAQIDRTNFVNVQIDGDIVRIFHNGAPVRVHPRRHPVEKEEVIWSHHRR